ncbi:MAG: TlpA family protein disulfide reductase [Bacteroidetes bacterium]|nr:TlpA family protein disulfide reductase [Bacteroidota bacterium]
MKWQTIRAILLSSIFVISIGNAQLKKAPNFQLYDADGKMYELSKLRGKVVVLNFWATWCPPCRAEIPDFISVYSKYKEKGVEFIGIALDKEGWKPVKNFVSRAGINYPIVLGTPQVVQAYGGIEAIPTTFIVDKEGNIAGHRVGLLRGAELEKAIQQLLRR